MTWRKMTWRKMNWRTEGGSTRASRSPSRRLIALTLLASSGISAAGLAADDDLDRRIPPALDKAAAYLRPQIERMTSQPTTDYPMGRLALVVAAHLKAGGDVHAQVIDSAMRKLRDLPMRMTYGVACYLFALDAHYSALEKHARHVSEKTTKKPSKGDRTVARPVPAPKDDPVALETRRKIDLREMRRAVAWLVEARVHGKGYWSYTAEKRRRGLTHDYSNTQFAVLGLQIGLEHGIAVPRRVFKEIAERFVRTAKLDGSKRVLSLTTARTLQDLLENSSKKSVVKRWRVDPVGWGYTANDKALRASMTAAGVSSLQIALNGLGLSEGRLRREVQLTILRGLSWMDVHYDQYIRSKAPRLYDLYSFEKVGDLCQVDRIGEHDWYVDGATWLVDSQQKNGGWSLSRADPVYVQTCFAIFFLTRAARFAPASAPRVFTGKNADGINPDLVYVTKLGGFTSARSVLDVLARARSARILPSCREAIANTLPRYRGRLAGLLLDLWSRKSDRATRFAREALEEITGLEGRKREFYEAWAEAYVRFDELASASKGSARDAGALLAEARGVPLQSLLIDWIRREEIYELAPELVELLATTESAALRRTLHSMLENWSGKRRSRPDDDDADGWVRCVEGWRSWSGDHAQHLRTKRQVDEIASDLLRASDEVAAGLVERLVRIGPPALPFLRLALEREQASIWLLECLERLEGRESGLEALGH